MSCIRSNLAGRDFARVPNHRRRRWLQDRGSTESRPTVKCSQWYPLRFGLFSLLLPFLDAIIVDAAKREQFFFIVNHLLAGGARERVIFHQENRLLGTDFLAETAEDATKHVNLKLLRHLLRVRPVGLRAVRAGWDDSYGFGRTDEFAKLAGDALGVAFLVLHEIRRAAVTFGHDPFLLGILQRHFLFEKMAQRDFEPADDGWQVKPLPKVQFASLNNHFGLTTKEPRNKACSSLLLCFFVVQLRIHNTTAVKIMFASANGMNRRQPRSI